MVATMALYYRIQNNQIILSGDTYAVRDQIKTLGGRYIGQTKSWLLPDNEAIRAQVEKMGARDSLSGSNSVLNENNTKNGIGANSGTMNAGWDATAPLSYRPDNDRPEPSTLPQGESLSVRQLMDQIQASIQRRFSAPVWIIGEIQNLGFRPKGVFLSLAEPKDAASMTSSMSINATIWSNAIQSFLELHGKETMEALLVDGMKVRVLCSIGLYRDRGSISLSIIGIDPSYTKGAMALAREELLRELRKSGLAYKNSATFLTAFPLKIGLISAEGSRAKSDFLDQLHLYGYPGEVIFFAASMQGEALLTEVTLGIATLGSINCDLIILTRGGGSAGDLRWFDSPQIAHAIANCPIPVIAAIGHHEDQSIAEEICFHREKTPTAAADFIIHHLRKTTTRLDDAVGALSRTMDDRINDAERRYQYILARIQLATSERLMAARDQLFTLQNAVSGMCHTHMLNVTRALSTFATSLLVTGGSALAQHTRRLQISAGALATRMHTNQQAIAIRLQQAVNSLARMAYERLGLMHTLVAQKNAELHHTSQNRFMFFTHSINMLESVLNAQDPRSLLRKGFTQIKSVAGVITKISSVKRGEKLTARLIDGFLQLTVDDVISSQKGIPPHKKDS